MPSTEVTQVALSETTDLYNSAVPPAVEEDHPKELSGSVSPLKSDSVMWMRKRSGCEHHSVVEDTGTYT